MAVASGRMSKSFARQAKQTMTCVCVYVLKQKTHARDSHSTEIKLIWNNSNNMESYFRIVGDVPRANAHSLTQFMVHTMYVLLNKKLISQRYLHIN